jgi:hypothetical protein
VNSFSFRGIILLIYFIQTLDINTQKRHIGTLLKRTSLLKTGIRQSSRRYLTLSMYRNWINNKSSNKRISIKRNDLFLLFLLSLMFSIKENK